MSLISDSIPNFVNGVSQQPAQLRLSSQGQEQVNGFSTISSGLRKRPPTEHVTKIGSSPVSNAFVHLIDRDGVEQYQVVITGGTLAVYDLLGVQKTVNFTNAAYLTSILTADKSFSVVTVADYTFIVNKTRTVTASATLTAARPFEGLINVRLGNFGKSYQVLINGGLVGTAYATPNGTASDQTLLSTDSIALNVYNIMASAGYNTSPWALTLKGSVIYITNSTTDFTLGTIDGFNNTAMVAVKRKLQKFSDLPARAGFTGFSVEIVGDSTSDYDNYWVRFDTSNNSTGTWVETAAPGISVGVDPLNMPHLLIREADGTFTFKPATWTARGAGDAVSNPQPSFVGRKINDIFYFQNRLGFLADENYVQSETGKYFNLYRTTVRDLLDSDPVDVSAATNKVAILQHAVAFNKQLLLFSNQQQFLVDGLEIMSPKRVPLRPSTDFQVNTDAKPVSSGRNVYFTSNKGNWTAVREYFVEPNGEANDGTDVTAHVPYYIPSGVVKIASGANEDVLAMLSGSDRSKLFIYKYFYSGNEKLQSSWSQWTFESGGTILSCDFIKSVLYLVISRSDGLYFEKMDLGLGASLLGEPYQVNLDRKVKIFPASMTFDGTYTTINLTGVGFVPTGTEWRVVTHGGGAVTAAQILVPFSISPLRFTGDLRASNLTFGRRYTFSYTMSVLYLRTPSKGGGQMVVTEGRTQIRNLGFVHSDSGYYQVSVTPENRATYTYTYTGRVLGTPSATVGLQGLPNGVFTCPVMSQNTRANIVVTSDHPTPMALLSADWEAFYVDRSRRV